MNAAPSPGAAAVAALPACPSCGESGRWMVDADLSHRVAVYLTGSPVVHVDRCGPEFPDGGPVLVVGSVTCNACAVEAGPDLAPAIVAAARVAAADHGTEYRILTDYRQF